MGGSCRDLCIKASLGVCVLLVVGKISLKISPSVLSCVLYGTRYFMYRVWLVGLVERQGDYSHFHHYLVYARRANNSAPHSELDFICFVGAP